MHTNVLKLTIAFRFNLEEHARDIESVRRALKRTAFPAQHCARTIALIFTSYEKPEALMERIRPALDTDRIIGAWCETASQDVIALSGDVDPLVTRVRQGYADLRKLRETQDMRNAQRGDAIHEGSVKNFRSGASVQVFRKSRTKWKPSEDPNRPKR